MLAVRSAVAAAGSVGSPSWVPVSKLLMMACSISAGLIALGLVPSPLADGRDGRCGSGADGGLIVAGHASGDKGWGRGLAALAPEACGPSSWEFGAPKAPRS